MRGEILSKVGRVIAATTVLLGAPLIDARTSYAGGGQGDQQVIHRTTYDVHLPTRGGKTLTIDSQTGIYIPLISLRIGGEIGRELGIREILSHCQLAGNTDAVARPYSSEAIIAVTDPSCRTIYD